MNIEAVDYLDAIKRFMTPNTVVLCIVSSEEWLTIHRLCDPLISSFKKLGLNPLVRDNIIRVSYDWFIKHINPNTSPEQFYESIVGYYKDSIVILFGNTCSEYIRANVRSMYNLRKADEETR